MFSASRTLTFHFSHCHLLNKMCRHVPVVAIGSYTTVHIPESATVDTSTISNKTDILILRT